MKIKNEYLNLDQAIDWELIGPKNGAGWRVYCKQDGHSYLLHEGHSEKVAKAIHKVPEFLEFLRRDRDKLRYLGDAAQEWKQRTIEEFIK